MSEKKVPKPKLVAPVTRAKPRKKAKPGEKKPSASKLTDEELLTIEEQKPLTASEELFCEHYMVDSNGVQSYMKANPNCQYASARVGACRWLAKPNIQAHITRLRTEQVERLRITSDELVSGVMAIAKADHRELSEYYRLCCRYCYGVDNKYQRTTGEMERDRAEHERQEEERMAKADLLNKAYTPREFDEAGGEGYDGRRDPNPECPECFGWGVGRTIIKDTRKLSPEAAILYAGMEETKDGLKIKAHDKSSAQDKLMKHFGMYEADNVQKSNVPEKSPEEWAALYAAAQEDALRARDAMKARRAQIEQIDEQERLGTAGGAKPAAGEGAGAAA